VTAELSPGARLLVDQAVEQGLPERVGDAVALERVAELLLLDGNGGTDASP
jgi:hypothetical protein